MGSSESGGVRGSGAGSIVWVRRRNGSWWPGKILGPDELSASHLMSPRSGTPVKLLGREDASVDWYNLEKSKRVKAFRCGEFDDCIERAEASLGLPAKKREKYARREDAILHALELEKQFIERKCGKLARTNALRENSSDSERKELGRASAVMENGNGKLGSLELCKLDKTVAISNLVERKSIPLHIHKVKDGALPSLDERDTDLSCQLRDLPALGLKAGPMNKMFHASTDDPYFSDSDSRNSVGKRKRSLDGFAEEPLRKRRDRLHSFVKVRQNNADLHDTAFRPDFYRKGLPIDGVHHSIYLPSELHETIVAKKAGEMEMPISRLEVGTHRSQHGTLDEQTTSGSSEETESDSSETHSLEAHVEAGVMLSDAEMCIRPHPRILDRLQMQVGHESTSSDESDELSLDDRSQFYFNDPSPAAGVSKWQLKGKRNVRSINKRPIERFSNGSHIELRGGSMGQRALNHSLSYYLDNGCTNDTDFIEDDFDPRSQGFSKRGYFSSLSAARRQNFIGQNMFDLEELTWGRPLRRYWEERGGFFNPIYGSRNGQRLLIDVDLKVQANRQGGGEHVPWVSLMSRLNGKAIIGHPIQIETLEEGSTDILVSTSDSCGNVKYDTDGSRVAPVWRTAKRTANFRVPRPQPSSSQMDGDEDADYQYIRQLGKVRSKKLLASNSVRKGILMKKKTHSSNALAKSPHQGTKKKVNLSSSQKTKTLSSIGFNQKFPTKKKEDDSSYYVDGVMKSVDSGPPTVACIPVKLVFSRLLEAVGRSPSAPAKHGVSVNSNKERNPALGTL